MWKPDQRAWTTAHLQPEQVGVERVGKFPGAAARIHRVRGAIEHRAVFEDEMIPRGFMPRRARARERELLEAQRAQIAFKIPRGGRAAGECLRGTRLERAGEMIDRNLPPAGVCLPVQPLDERLVYLVSSSGWKQILRRTGRESSYAFAL